MIGRELALQARACAGWLVALIGFSLCISTAFDGMLVAATLIAWLIALPLAGRESLRGWLEIRPAFVALLLLALLLIACTYSPAPWKAAWSAFAKYLDLLLIPIFVWAAPSLAVRRRALFLFLCGVAANVLVSYGSALGLWERIPGLHTQQSYPVGFRLSITHGVLVSIAVYLLLLLARDARRPVLRAAYAALAALFAHNVLFVVTGRTGYAVLGALLAYFAFYAIKDRRRVLLALFATTALFASAYLGSERFPTRVQDIASDLRKWQPGAGDDTSVGQRVGYYSTTFDIIRDHPLGGVGTGAFSKAYADKVRGTSAPATGNPHNDYLMLAAQAGIPAMLLLVALYIMLWREAPRLATRFERDAMRGLVLTMATAGLFNSALMDHVEGLLFAWAAGLLYASRRATAGSL